MVASSADFTHWAPKEKVEDNPNKRYVWAFSLVVTATVVCMMFEQSFAPANILMTYLLAVILSALYLGRGASIFTSILSILIFDFIFIPPKYTLEIADTEYLLTLIGFIVVSMVISSLVNQRRGVTRTASEREKESNLLFALNHELAQAHSIPEIGLLLEKHLSLDIGSQFRIYLPKKNILHAHSFESFEITPTDAEMLNAVWTYEHNEVSGSGVNLLPSSEATFYPLSTDDKAIGVLEFKPVSPNGTASTQRQRLIKAICTQIKLAIQRIEMAEQNKQVEILKATEKLQTALLNSVSHELRTPLVSITGALTFLEEQEDIKRNNTETELVQNAILESQRLNRLVSNLLDITRLETGALHEKKESVDFADLIGSTLDQMYERVKDRTIHVQISEDLPKCMVDFRLISHVLQNLIDNAIKYSPKEQPVTIDVDQAMIKGVSMIEIKILDHGIGIPQGELSSAFSKFYRGSNIGTKNGLGLGLAICKGIIEAHNGQISIHNRDEGGISVNILLPTQ